MVLTDWFIALFACASNSIHFDWTSICLPLVWTLIITASCKDFRLSFLFHVLTLQMNRKVKLFDCAWCPPPNQQQHLRQIIVVGMCIRSTFIISFFKRHLYCSDCKNWSVIAVDWLSSWHVFMRVSHLILHLFRADEWMQALNFLSPPALADAVTPLPVTGKHKNVSVPGQ